MTLSGEAGSLVAEIGMLLLHVSRSLCSWIAERTCSWSRRHYAALRIYRPDRVLNGAGPDGRCSELSCGWRAL